jgi:hypothetical protein
MARAKAKKEPDELTEDDYVSGSYNVVRRDFYGDPGKNVGAGLTKEAAEEYVRVRSQEGESCHYEVVPV